MADQGRLGYRSYRAPESSESEQEQEHFESADEESPPATQTPVTGTSTPVRTPISRISGLGPAYPFSRRGSPFSGRATPAFTPRGSPSITRTHSTSAQSLIIPIPIVTPIDLSSLGIPPTDKVTEIVERFNAFASEAFNPETPVEMSNFPPEQPPTGNAPQNPEQPPQQQQQVFDPYPAVDGRERSRQPKDFNGDESKYKLWIQMVENYLIANAQRFSTTS